MPWGAPYQSFSWDLLFLNGAITRSTVEGAASSPVAPRGIRGLLTQAQSNIEAKK